MEPNVAFAKLLDAWESPNDLAATELYTLIKNDVSLRYWCGLIDVRAENSDDWTWQVLNRSIARENTFGTGGLLAGRGRLGDFADVMPRHTSAIRHQQAEAVNTKRPTVGSHSLKIIGMYVFFDLLFIPEKSVGRPSWLMACARTRFSTRVSSGGLVLDPIDEQILFLCAAGQTAKAIAPELDLSHRTVEDRLSKLKKRTGAKTLSELLLLVASEARLKEFSVSPDETIFS